jgi:hypothetical protein
MKNFKMKHAVLIALGAILIVPILNTANLYGTYSNLEGLEKDFARYLLGAAIEYAIFLCVKGGYRPAGIFFAFLSLIIGSIYHVHYDDIRNFNGYYTREFHAAIIIQIAISSAVYFLSEFYVFILKKEAAIKTIKQLEKEVSDNLLELSSIAIRKQDLENSLTDKTKDYHRAENNLMNSYKERERIEQEIAQLKKVKAGMSTKKQKEKDTFILNQ